MSGNQALLPNYQNSSLLLSDLFNSLRLQNDQSLTTFNQSLETRRFQLGEELAIYNLSSAVDQPNNGNFYLINQGRVRLLGLDAVEGREVSAMVLETGASFGTEAIFANIPSLTRAIAASDGEISWISFTQLQPYLEQPQLKEYLVATATTRAKLLFLKTATELRRLSGQQLQQLLPDLVTLEIPAGSQLADFCQDGYFWLVSGQINGKALLESWGDTPDDWTATSDLLVYQLPKSYQELATSGDAATPNGKTPRHKPVIPPKSRDSVIPAAPANHNPTAILNAAQADRPAFPEPSRRRLQRNWWQRYPFIQQQSSSDCGAACLAMIGQYWGKRFSLNTLRNLAGVGRSGASLKVSPRQQKVWGFKQDRYGHL